MDRARSDQLATDVAPRLLRSQSMNSLPLRNDFDAVADQYELRGTQREAARSMINVGQGGKVSDHVGPLAEAGAHPLQALMSLHVIFSTTHKRGQEAMAAAPKH